MVGINKIQIPANNPIWIQSIFRRETFLYPDHTCETAIVQVIKVPKTNRGKARTAKIPINVKKAARRISINFIFLIEISMLVQRITTESPK